MCRWKTLIYSCGHANRFDVFSVSCSHQKTIEKYEAFRRQENYSVTLEKEMSNLEKVLDLRHKCVEGQSFSREFIITKCEVCAAKKGWEHAKTEYFDDLGIGAGLSTDQGENGTGNQNSNGMMSGRSIANETGKGIAERNRKRKAEEDVKGIIQQDRKEEVEGENEGIGRTYGRTRPEIEVKGEKMKRQAIRTDN